jgi:hypothetical protein
MRVVPPGCLGLAVLTSAVCATLPDGRAALGERMPGEQAGGSERGWIALSETVGRRYQQVTVVDPRRKVKCAYQTDLASGVIPLRSVRNIYWDLRMSDNNGQKPLSQETQALTEQR